jgi:hypothetical protein
MQRISMVALRATVRQVIRGVALVGAANVQAHNDRRAEKTAEAAKYDAFGPNHGGAFRPFDCGRSAFQFPGRLRPARQRRRSPPFAHC